MPAELPRPASRRTVLATGVFSLVSFAGCSALSSQPGMLELVVFNHTERPYTVETSLLRVESDLSRSEASIYSESIDVEPEGEARREDVAENQQYLVEYEVYEEKSRLTDEDHAHYYPDDDGNASEIAFDIHPPGVITRR